MKDIVRTSCNVYLVVRHILKLGFFNSFNATWLGYGSSISLSLVRPTSG